jgi:hypothetical protein
MAKKCRGRGGKVRKHDRPHAKKGELKPDRIYFHKYRPWPKMYMIQRLDTGEQEEFQSWLEALASLEKRFPDCRIRQSSDMFVILPPQHNK